MKNKLGVKQSERYIYRYTCHDQELSLCSLEIRQMFEVDPSWYQSTAIVDSEIEVSAQRSPYVKYRLQVLLSSVSFEALLREAEAMMLSEVYKVVALEVIQDGRASKLPYEQRRRKERELGVAIGGAVSLEQPNVLLGVMQLEGEWLLGIYEPHAGMWQQYDRKPRHYSTALSTRVARAIINIILPQLDRSITLLDPCCGIGTVLMQACDQGVSVKGYDINPLAVVGARENIAAFEMNCSIGIADMRELQGHYAAAVLDLPYNHCSVLPEAERREMLQALSRVADKAVIISVEPIKHELEAIGATIIDAGHVQKTHFKRDVWLVQFNK